MKTRFIALIALALASLLCFGCKPGTGGGGGYPITFQIFNIPAGMTSNHIVVNVSEKNGAVYTQTGQIDSQITGTDFTSAIMEYSLAGGTIGSQSKKYNGDVVLSMDIYIDANDNGTFTDSGFDIADGVNFQDIPFSNEELYSINYAMLHIAGT
jgi:hypothetical protein